MLTGLMLPGGGQRSPSLPGQEQTEAGLTELEAGAMEATSGKFSADLGPQLDILTQNLWTGAQESAF